MILNFGLQLFKIFRGFTYTGLLQCQLKIYVKNIVDKQQIA